MKKKLKKGYFGIGIYEAKETTNIGTLWRSAHNFGADFIFTIGKRYKKQRTDTTKATRSIPLFEYENWKEFEKSVPLDSEIVCIEQTEGAKELSEANHPKMAVYVLGAEDYGIPEDLMKGHQKIFIDTVSCLNVAVAGSIVMYDRKLKI